MLYADQPEPLARTYKLGVLVRHREFRRPAVRQHRPVAGQSGEHRHSAEHHGDYGIYAVADQMVWVDPKEIRPDGQPVLRAHGHAAGGSQPDRFQPECRLDVPRADSCIATTTRSASAWAMPRSAAARRRWIRTPRSSPGTFVPVRSGETYVEVTYQYQVTPWWQMQPDIQYVFNPGGGIANPNVPAQRVSNEAGARRAHQHSVLI